MARRHKYTDDELIWAAYSEAPEDQRLVKSITEMDDRARQIWLTIVKRRFHNGMTVYRAVNGDLRWLMS